MQAGVAAQMGHPVGEAGEKMLRTVYAMGEEAVNVACAVAKLGGRAVFLGRLGVDADADAFGDRLLETLRETGVETVPLPSWNGVHGENGDRAESAVNAVNDNNAANAKNAVNAENDGIDGNDGIGRTGGTGEIGEIGFGPGDILHFSSADLVDAAAKLAHRRVIEAARRNGGFISFAPAARLSPGPDSDARREAALEWLPLAHLVKIGRDDLTFLTGMEEEQPALRSLFQGNVEHVLYTRGSRGAEWISKRFRAFLPGLPVDTADTAGAGDAFVGALLYQLQRSELSELDGTVAATLLRFANTAAALSTTRMGAIPSLPALAEVNARL